jgi:glycosyltransferase involved in cell wall biosynthesis
VNQVQAGPLPIPEATVVICTRNRAASLARTLDSIAEAARGVTQSWELLIVDNGSTDHTPTVVDQYRAVLPIRRVFQPSPGLSNARNAGVAAGRGHYFLWTDDDVLVHEGWLKAYLDAFARHPEQAVFGGMAVPRFEQPQRDWFVKAAGDLKSLLAIRDRTEWADIAHDRVPYGLNYAIRGDEQREHPYDPELGVAPGRRRGGEEVAVIRAILSKGGSGIWIWDAKVFHLIPTQRQSAKYIYEFYRAEGFDLPIATLNWGPGRFAKYLAPTARAALAAAHLSVMWVSGGRWPRSLREIARSHGSLDRLRREGESCRG